MKYYNFNFCCFLSLTKTEWSHALIHRSLGGPLFLYVNFTRMESLDASISVISGDHYTTTAHSTSVNSSYLMGGILPLKSPIPQENFQATPSLLACESSINLTLSACGKLYLYCIFVLYCKITQNTHTVITHN